MSLFIWFLIIRTSSKVLSKFILCSFSFSSLGYHPKFYLGLFTCSFSFSSLGHHPRFYLRFCSYGFLSSGHHPQFYLSLFIVPLVSHIWDAIIGSIRVHWFFLWLLIFGTQNQSKFFFSFSFSSLVCHLRFYLCSFIFSFGLSSLGCHLRFYLRLFFVHLFSHYWHAILGLPKFIRLFILFLIIGTPS